MFLLLQQLQYNLYSHFFLYELTRVFFYVIWKTRNIAKYQKKGIRKSMVFNMIKHEMQFLLKYLKPNTNNEAFVHYE